MDQLPDLLLFEIFQRLPLKSIFRSKSVSKRWFAIISEPLFAQSYIKKTSTNPLSWAIFSGSEQVGIQERTFVRHPDSPSTRYLLQVIAPINSPAASIKFLNSSNGLLLFCTFDDYEILHYYVCNPLTMKYVCLPKPVSQPTWFNEGFEVQKESGNFLVVRLGPLRKSMFFTVDVFCSKSGKWRFLVLYSPRRINSFIKRRHAVYYNGKAYWLVSNSCILTFDLENTATELGVVDLPGARPSAFVGVLGISCELLHYMEVYGLLNDGELVQTLRVWLFKDDDAKEWFLEYELELREFASTDEFTYNLFLSPLHHMQPLAFHPFDSDVVYLAGEHHLFCCNISTRIIEMVYYERYLHDFIVKFEAFLFVLPSWPTQVPRPSWEATF